MFTPLFICDTIINEPLRMFRVNSFVRVACRLIVDENPLGFQTTYQ